MKTIPQALFELACTVRQHAYAPYSNFLVGACIETDKKNVFVGCNVENASYGLTGCAESNAIAAMVAAGDRHIRQVMVVVKGPALSAPCGACLQRLYEFSAPDTMIHLCNLDKNHEFYKINELLPRAFGRADLMK